MIRVTATEVKEVIETNLSDDACLPFIMSANILVTAHCTGTAEEKKEIERWLAAHFLALRDKEMQSESVGGASYTRKSMVKGPGLESTEWGQHALLLSNGDLSNVSRRKITFDVAYQVEDA